jgi:hypothetical protein
MKKILLSLAAMVLFSFVTHAQTVDQLFAKYANEEGVEHVNVGKLGMIFAGLFGETMGINGVDVLSFEHCTPSVREKLNGDIHSLNDPGYETLMTVNGNDEQVRMLVKTKGDIIHELVVLATERNEMALVRIRGKINPADIARVIKRN